MPRSVVVDGGGVLVASGNLVGTAPADAELLALDWTAITVGRFLGMRHEGKRDRGRTELGIALGIVDEWFPVRSLVADTLDRAPNSAVDSLDSWSALLLAEQLELPLLTASDEVTSERIEILRPW